MAIQNLHAKGISSSEILTSWKAVPGATGYEIRHRLYQPIAAETPGLSVDLNYGNPANFTAVDGQTGKIHVSNQASYTLNGHKAKVTWNRTADKFLTTYIYLNNITNVTLQDVHILSAEYDFDSAWHSVFISNCDTVNISRCSFHGTVRAYHVRTENVRKIYIDNVEVKGFDYGGGVNSMGGGIRIDNGNYAQPNTDLEDLEIRHCWFHDHFTQPHVGHLDALLIESSDNGLIEYCLFENWEKQDGSLDISHRRYVSYSPQYINKTTNVRNCKMVNCRASKCAGGSELSNKIIFTDIEHIETSLHYYSYNYHIEYHNCTFDETFSTADRLIALLGLTSSVKFENCTFKFTTLLNRFLHDNDGNARTSYLNFLFKNCTWYVTEANVNKWVEGAVTWTAWNTFRDSALVENGQRFNP